MKKKYNLRTGLFFLKKETYFNTKNNIIHLKFMLVVFFGFSTSFGQTTVNFTATGNGTWTAPCDVTSITLEVWGAGGGGQRANGNPSAGGGGAGGGYVRTTYAVTPGTTYNLYVGIGGTGNSGGDGQDSWFDTNSTIIAVGGRGAGGAVTTNSTWGTGATAFTTGNVGGGGTIISTYGGNGGNAGNNFSGGGGSSAGDIDGNSAAGMAAGAAPTNGYAGAAGTNSNGAGAGGGIGAGGAGGRTAQNTDRFGGAGGRGQIRITYTSTLAIYCSPTFTSGIEPITNVTFAGINNTTSNTVNGTPALESFCAAGTVIQGSPSNSISISGNTDGNFTNNIRVYIDWDRNGTFGNLANEIYNIGTITNSTGVDFISLTGNIAVPMTAALGLTKMRVMKRFGGYPTGPCQTGTGFGQVEDYLIQVNPRPVCTTPTLQPTTLNLTSTGTTLAGSFTMPIPPADNYLVVINTTGITPVPVNGTTYTIGSTIGAGNTVIDTDNNNVFSTTGLTILTNYYVFVFSYNSVCIGGPLYNTTSPLNGSIATLSVDYCNSLSTSDASRIFINNVSFLGSLNDISNLNSSFSLLPSGYQNFTSLGNRAVQAQGEGMNIIASSNARGRWKAWVDWNKDGDFNDPGEEIYNPGAFAGITLNFGFVIPPGTPTGDYRIRFRVYNSFYLTLENFNYNFNSCETFDARNINYGPPLGTVSSIEYGEAEDYLFTVVASCLNVITSITHGEVCGSGPVTLNVTGSVGVTSFRWYSNETGGLPIATTPTGTWTTPSLTNTTTYYVTAVNGCESLVRTPVIATVSPIPTLSFSPSNPIICGNNAIVSLTAAGDTEQVFLVNENFESGTLGVFSNVNTDANAASFDNQSRWQVRTSTFIPTGQVWLPAISSGFGANRFAMATGDINPLAPNDIENSLTLTTGVNTANFTDLTLTMKLYFSRYLPDDNVSLTEFVTIEASTNNFTTSTTIANYVADVGIGSRFSNLSFDLSAFVNQPNLRFRIRHRVYSTSTGWLPDGVAVDEIKLFGTRPLTTSFNYDTSSVDAFSDFACTVSYSSGSPATTIYVRPTMSQLENATFTIPVNTTLSNGCSIAGNIVVVNNTKLYNNPSNSDWNNPLNWRPNGVPTSDNCVVVINDSDIPNSNYQAYARNLRVANTGNLNLGTSSYLTVTENVIVDAGGVFEIENNGSLIQIDNVINTGNIIYKRIANAIKGTDYVYWSSPVSGQIVNGIYTTPTQGSRFRWNTTMLNANGAQGGWVNASGNAMSTGIGYIVRGSSIASMPATNILSTFTGVPNNGSINVPIERGSYTGAPYTSPNGAIVNNLDDNWNLLGNPYPSALNALQFLFDNNTKIIGNVRLWTHGTDLALTGTTVNNPYYGNFAYNYSSSDYYFINYTGTTIPGGSDLVKSGQAFFVQMIDGPVGSNTVNFNNAQRSNSFENNNFFRNAENSSNENSISNLERHRIWLDIVNANNQSTTTLIGYVESASDTKDSFFDATEKPSGSLGIYSNIDEETFAIQGRSLPFLVSDEVSITFKTTNSGIHHLAILAVDGLFENQFIYVKDEFLNVIHDLKSAPYSFSTEAGTHQNRFKIVYQNETLGIPVVAKNQVVAYKDKTKSIQISTGNLTMDKVKVFDIQGRLIKTASDINNNKLSIDTQDMADQVLMVSITTTDNLTITKKVF